MRVRNSRVRTKVAALLLSLTALWAFAAWVTLQDGLNLLSLSTLDTKTGRPGNALITTLQQERRLTLIYVSRPSAQQRAVLQAQRTRSDQAVARFRDLASGSDVKRAMSDVGEKRLREAFQQLDALASGRSAIDSGQISRTEAVRPFNNVIDAVFQVFGSSAGLDDEILAKDSRTLIALTRAKEVLSREDALLAGILAAGRFGPGEYSLLVQNIGNQRFLHAEAAADLPEADRAKYDAYAQGAQVVHLRALEDRIIQTGGRTTRTLPVRADEWAAAVEPVLAGNQKLVETAGDGIVERSRPLAIGVVIRLIMAGGLGLLAVIASVIVSITTARALIRQLEKLRDAAHDLSDNKLPGIVERLGHGETVDVAKEAPPLRFGDDEVGQVGQAFNAVQETAVRTAVEQAELRRGIRDVLLSLARRSQTLVHRQLTLLDAMERREVEEQELEDLFRLDHLATRMRRNAENLIVLSGSTPARGWKKAVPMVDVVRAAVGEVEDYTRVTVLPMGPVSLTGRAVGDITHLLAELIENAVSFSPPYTLVQVSGHQVASGYAIEIEDRGLGMTDERLADINGRIMDPPEFNMSSSVQLGLYVVGRLAQRYELQVSLKRSAYGGTTAVVLVPRELVEQSEGDDPSTSGENPVPAAVGAPRDGDPVQIDELRTARAEKPVLRAGTADKSVPPAPRSVPEPRIPSEPAIAESSRDTEIPADSDTTPSGLPLRVPQASLAPALRTDGPTTVEDLDEEDPGTRSPEEIRQMFGSYQSGTRRGRHAAANKVGKGPADTPGE